MKWDDWRGSLDGRATFWSKTLLRLFGWRVDLHKFVAADGPGCFHTHPAYAVRFILFGGYFEQLECGAYRAWFPFRVGLVKPELSHRVDHLVNGRVSYSLWIRGPKLKHAYPVDTQER